MVEHQDDRGSQIVIVPGAAYTALGEETLSTTKFKNCIGMDRNVSSIVEATAVQYCMLHDLLRPDGVLMQRATTNPSIAQRDRDSSAARGLPPGRTVRTASRLSRLPRR